MDPADTEQPTESKTKNLWTVLPPPLRRVAVATVILLVLWGVMIPASSMIFKGNAPEMAPEAVPETTEMLPPSPPATPEPSVADEPAPPPPPPPPAPVAEVGALLAKETERRVVAEASVQALREELARQSQAIEALRVEQQAMQRAWAEWQGHSEWQLLNLQEEFATSARIALRPVAGEDASFWQKLKANTAQLISIRRVGAVEGDDAGAMIARAEVALRAGNVDVALQEIRALPPEQAAAFDAWRTHAEARVAALAALGK